MKFSIISFFASLAVVSQVLATPTPQSTDVVYHCGGESGAVCPTGYRCCGPISVTLGGTCFKGTTGVCPL